MADSDEIARRLGVPMDLLPAWKKAFLPRSAPAAAPELRPGDPGFSLMPSEATPAGPPPPPPPSGPRPGDPGFSIAGAAPPPLTRAPTREAPSRPMSAAEAFAITNKGVEDAAAMERMKRQGRREGFAVTPDLDPRIAAKLGAMGTQTQSAVRDQLATNEQKKNLEGATFDDSGTPAASAPVLVSKGGRTPHSWTTQTQEGMKFAPETREKQDQAEGAHLGAVEAARDAGLAEAQREYAYLDAHEKLQQARADEIKAREAQHAKMMDTQLAKLTKMTDAVSRDDASTREWWQNKDGGIGAGLIFGAVGTMLGALGQSLQHSPVNQGLESLRESIRQHIQGQKDAAQEKRMKLEDQRGLLGTMAKTFGDDRVAEEAAWMAYLQKAQTTMAKIAAQSKDATIQARYKLARAGVMDEIASHAQKWDALTQDHVTRVQNDVNAPPVYSGGTAGAPIDKHTREEITKISEGREKAGLPAALSELKDIDRTVDTFGSGDIAGVGAVKDYIPSLLISDEGVANRQAVATLKNKVRKSIAGASLTEGEKVELNKQLEGAHDAPSLRRVVQSFRQSLHEQDKNIRAGGSDQANEEFDRRLQANEKRVVPLNKPSTPHFRRPE